MANTLSDYYATKRDKVKMFDNHELADNATKKLRGERKAKFFLNELNIYFSKNSTSNPEIIAKIVNYVNEAANICLLQPSINSKYYLYRLQIILLQTKNDYQTTIKICD